MSECTDYTMTTQQAADVTALVGVPLAGRISLLTDYCNEHGSERLVELFAQFIGMANAVADNCRNMTDLVLIGELGMHPDRFDSLNLPTVLGACQGVVLAAQCDPAGACEGCAYRVGSMANQSPMATSDAAYMAFDQRGFMCHAETDDRGNPTKVCVGHAKAFKCAGDA
ncbi:hypothetical protein [Pseudomonas sp. TWP3-2]|uniref:hypothetical protein n=1 Tax=Pseudomonas sp. TWP3-2 TaxID=2804574 RepID=UPI003CE83258